MYNTINNRTGHVLTTNEYSAAHEPCDDDDLSDPDGNVLATGRARVEPPLPKKWYTGMACLLIQCRPVLFPRLGKSRVIHIRNIPNEASEPEVIQLGVQFGRVSNVLVLKGKNQAFLEMADENSAAAMVACLSANPPQVRGRTVYVQFSNHRELKTDQNHSMGNPEFQTNSPASGSPLPLSGMSEPGVPQGAAQDNCGRNTVLRVIVESLLYPVSLEILHQIFQRFGKVLKIVTFTKNNSFQVSAEDVEGCVVLY